MMKVDLSVQCCDGSGWYLKNVPFGHPDFGKLFRCECGRSGNPEGRRESLAAALRGYSECTFESWDLERQLEPNSWGGISYSTADQQKALRIATRKAKEYAADPDGFLFLFGSFGAGKTHLAAAIGRECASRNLRVQYHNIPRLFDELRGAAGDFAVDEALNPLLNCDVLILDDIGAEEAASQFIQGRLFRIIDERINKSIIFTSNLDQKTLGDKLGGRLASRMFMAETIWLPVSDYRKHMGKAR